jgi:hypothetical protein
MQSTFKELSNLPVFAFNEVIECIDVDRIKSRLVICSITGKFKAFTVEKNGDYLLQFFLGFLEFIFIYLGTLIPLWRKDPEESSSGNGVIPRSVKLVGKGDRAVIFGLQSGTMCVPFVLSYISMP